MSTLTEPRPSIAAMLAAAGISVEPQGRIWTVLSDGMPVCWMHSQDEAETVAYEMAAELIGAGLV